MYKQIIIARKDLSLSPGKLAAQCSHASIAFLTNQIRNIAKPITMSIMTGDKIWWYEANLDFEPDLYEQWIDGEFTKVVCQARNKNHLLKAVKMAEELGMKEGEDFFLIKDNCHTELEPEEYDEDGIGRTLTCIGFKPMDSEVIEKISKKYQLYK